MHEDLFCEQGDAYPLLCWPLKEDLKRGCMNNPVGEVCFEEWKRWKRERGKRHVGGMENEYSLGSNSLVRRMKISASQ